VVAFSVDTVSVTVGGTGCGLSVGDGVAASVGVDDVVSVVTTDGSGVSDVAGERTTPAGRVESFDTVITAKMIAASRNIPRPPATTAAGDR
jgi:hypothetical protein